MAKSSTEGQVVSRAREIRAIRVKRIPNSDVKKGAEILYRLAMRRYVSPSEDQKAAQQLARLFYLSVGGKV